jgi:hypothetical protein
MNFLKLILFAFTICACIPALAIEAGSAGQVLRVPSSGGKAKMGPLDLSATNATTNTLNATTKLSGLTSGACLFGNSSGGGVLLQPTSSNCFWDITNNALSLGASSLPNTSTIFNVASTSKGSIPAPKMSGTQRNAIATPIVGMQIYNTDTNQLNVYNGAAWVAVGSGSGGGAKNYLSSSTAGVNNADFETNSTTGWSLGTIGTLTNGLPTGSPTFGSGASGNLSITTISSGPLAGSYSLDYVSSAATTVGNMIASNAFTIDKEDQANVLTYSLKYFSATNPVNVNWTGTSSSSFAVAAWDVTNSTWLPVSNPFKFIQNSGVGTVAGTFQTATNTVQLRFVLYTPNASAGALTMYLDDFSVGPQANSLPSSVIAWNGSNASQGITANVTNLLATTNYDSSGGWNGTQYTVPVSGTYIVSAGYSASAPVTIQPYLNGTVYISTAKFSSATASTDGSGSSVMANLKAGDLISFRGSTSVTVTAWTVGIFQIGGGSVGPAGQVVAASAHITSGTTVTTPNPYNFDTVDLDTTGSITTGASWKFVAPVSGNYYVETTLTFGGANDVVLYKNAAKYRVLMTSGASGSAGGTTVPLNAGDNIYIAGSANGAPSTTTAGTIAQSNSISIFLLQGPSSAQSSTATVAASYYMSTNQSVTANTTRINFDTKEYDYTNSTVTGASWAFTAPMSGLYEVNVLVSESVNSNYSVFIYKNGSIAKYITSRIGNGPGRGATDIQLNAGDSIWLISDTNQTFVGGSITTGISYITIKKVSN